MKKSVVKQVTFEEDNTSSTSFEERLWNFLTSCGEEGSLLMEMYTNFPNNSGRHIRYKVKEFTIKGMLDTDHTCRCGRSTIYTAKKYKKSKAIINPTTKNIHHKIRDTDIKHIRKKSTKNKVV
jgi:hypothetical protein